jgi:hypothetical protein
LLTLIVTPVAYALFDDLKLLVQRWRGKGAREIPALLPSPEPAVAAQTQHTQAAIEADEAPLG